MLRAVVWAKDDLCVSMKHFKISKPVLALPKLHFGALRLKCANPAALSLSLSRAVIVRLTLVYEAFDLIEPVSVKIAL